MELLIDKDLDHTIQPQVQILINVLVIANVSNSSFQRHQVILHKTTTTTLPE